MTEPGAEDVPEGARERAGGPSVPAASPVVVKPVVLPETYDGTKSWDEWYFHFENVAVVNGWDDILKLKWLRVRLTGRAQKALQRIPESSLTTYETARTALKSRFEPVSRQTRYQAEFQTRRKRASEGWADFADDIKSLADKAYPTLQEEAREQLAINAYLQQLQPPQVAFSVKQKRPETLDDAVATTLEMESYMTEMGVTSMLSLTEEPAVCSVTDTSATVDRLTRVVEQLSEQVAKLQQGMHSHREPSSTPSRIFRGECWKCHQRGHIARNCPKVTSTQQGN